MAHNRTIILNTSSERLEKKVNTLLLFLNIAEQRLLEVAEIQSNTNSTFDEARDLVKAIQYLFLENTTDEEETGSFDIEYWIDNNQSKINLI